MQNSNFIEANRQRWDATADIHARQGFDVLLASVQRNDFNTLDTTARRLMEKLDLCNKSVAQLGCNNGIELISMKKSGAGRCVGFDISAPFINQAQQLAVAAGTDVQFVCSAVDAIDAQFIGLFDIVFVSVGVLGWIPDLTNFFKVATQLLKVGGSILIYEMHPVLDMFEDADSKTINASYFQKVPFVMDGEADYLDPSKTVNLRSYWFHHRLADVIGAALAQQLSLRHFDEYAHDVSMSYAKFALSEPIPPMSYSVIFAK
jgi:2-polyprenyl-3-methyl-5-hydroxy-6-metoxy-1,4-benzoquinol methylase